MRASSLTERTLNARRNHILQPAQDIGREPWPVTQRDLAKRLGFSLGKANFCLKALVEKGGLKINNFRNSEDKLASAYFLTPSGIEEMARITVQFLAIKMQEYERPRTEIEELQREAENYGS